MDFPFYIKLGPFSLSLHLLLETLAFIIGFRYFLYLRKQHPDQINTSNRIWILIGAAAGAFLFSRLLGVAEDPVAIFNGSIGWLHYFQSKTIVGGLLGGLLGVELTKYAIGENHSSGDLFTFPIILAMIIGRLGCFSAGVHEPTFGLPSSLPWAMDLGDGLSRHPTNLYEILFLGLIGIGLYFLERKYTFHSGVRFKLFMIGYLSFRFAIEFLKPYEPLAWQLSSIQWACILGLIYYYRTWMFPTKLAHA